MTDDNISRKERLDAFVAAMDGERYAHILEHAQNLITKGFVLDLTYDQIIDKLIEREYDQYNTK